jgi:hypothetical protein
MVPTYHSTCLNSLYFETCTYTHYLQFPGKIFGQLKKCSQFFSGVEHQPEPLLQRDVQLYWNSKKSHNTVTVIYFLLLV